MWTAPKQQEKCSGSSMRAVNVLCLMNFQCEMATSPVRQVTVVFRAKLSTPYESSNSVDMASLRANLSNVLTRQDERTPITMNGGRYFIEPGPCGLTVPQLNSPHCLDSAPTEQASADVSTSPQDSNVTTIVAIMSVSLAVVVLGGCIVYLVIGLRIM